MYGSKSILYLLPESLPGTRVWSTLQPAFEVKRAQRQTSHRSYYDTFDWRLYKSGLCLHRDREHYELHSLHDDSVVAQVDASGERKFWWDFPDGALRDALRQCLQERALISLLHVKIDRQAASVFDGRGRPIAHVAVENAMPSGGSKHARVLELCAVEGQEREFDALREAIVRGKLSVDDGTWFELVLAYGGREPGDYSSKLNVRLEAKMTARQAAIKIFRRLLMTMERNEEGLCNDIDTEFLHDFRVAVRRTRAGLSQIRHVFPAESIKPFRRAFSQLGGLSNRLRDLDVYLLSKSHYRGLVPESNRTALEPLFETLVAERAKALRGVVGGIRSPGYRKAISEWSIYLDGMAADGGEATGAANANKPIGTLASHWIRKRHGKVVQIGGTIDDSSPPADFHSLRIEVKKLRYLLEFFASLYPRTAMTTLVKHLKKLQDNLGEFNDLSVQQEELKQQLLSHDYADDTRKAIALLITKLEQRQSRVKKAYGRNFDGFAGPQNENRYRRLFGATENGDDSHKPVLEPIHKEETNMKHVILVRHATAVKKAPSKSDFDRSLRKSGEKEARDMVKRTKDLVGKPALIITSPANRAVETAKVFAKGLGYPVKKIELHEALYEELAPETFLQFLKGLDDKVDSVMIFGHDPSFTEFARFLLPDFDEALPKCGVVVAGINTTAWAEIAPKHSKAEQFFYPGDRAATKTTEREIRKQLGARIETTLAETLSDFGIDGSTYVKDELHRASSKLAKRLASQANAAERAKGSKRQATDSKEKPA